MKAKANIFLKKYIPKWNSIFKKTIKKDKNDKTKGIKNKKIKEKKLKKMKAKANIFLKKVNEKALLRKR